MEQAAREMADMTRYLLAFAGEGRYAARPVSLNRLVERALAALDQTSWPNVRFVRKLDPELPEVDADPTQIEQCCLQPGHETLSRRSQAVAARSRFRRLRARASRRSCCRSATTAWG